MRLLSRNVRGIGAAAKRRSFQNLLRRQRCGIVMLQETKLECVTDKLVKQGILEIIGQRSIAWCVEGGFNMVMRVEECHGCSNNDRGIAVFCEFVSKAALCDIPLQGKTFTWFGSGNKCNRIDIFLASMEWFQRFDQLVVNNLPRELSNHSPIVLISDTCDSGMKPLRFFNVWLLNPQHIKEVECAWQEIRQDGGEVSLVRMMRAMKEMLKK
ncbi:hypothetical protein V6N13_007955 [Hibiscus sabdariffa]